MAGIRRFSKAIQKLDIIKEDTQDEFPGVLGVNIKGQSYVDVPNRAGYVYVRLRSNLNEVIQAYNTSVSPVYDLPVILIRDKTFNRYLVKGRDLGRYENWGTSSYLPRHGSQHSFGDDVFGGDVVWVYDRQFIPLSISPSGSRGASNVYINGDVAYWNGDWIYAGNTGSPDLFTYKPTGSSAKMVLVYINEYGNPAVLEGSTFDTSLTGMTQIIPYLPSLSTSLGIPIGAVRLLSGTTAIGWGSIYDLRPLLSQAAWVTPYQVQDEGSPLPRRSYLNFKGVTVWAVDNSGDDSTDIIISGSSSGGGHIIENEGTPLAQRENLNFKGRTVWATDNSPDTDISNSGTMVTISSTEPAPITGTFPGMLWIKPA